MNRLFLLLSLVMGVVVLTSNYLVQFPINHYGLENILTYGALSYPIAFLITDLANRSYGKKVARKIVYVGFSIGVSFTLFFSTDFADLISIRIAFGSGIAFLITDLANRTYGKFIARQIVYIGFAIGISFTLIFSTNFADLISLRIAIGSGTAFLFAQLLDVQIFDKLRKRDWFIAPLTSSLMGSTVDTFLFFSISFYATGVPWVTLAFGDLIVKILVALIMLIPFRFLLKTFKPV